MVTTEGKVKVLDFGLAKLKEEAAAEGPTVLPEEPVTEKGRPVGHREPRPSIALLVAVVFSAIVLEVVDLLKSRVDREN